MARLVKSNRTQTRARTLRTELNDSERLLWMLLRNRRFADHKFRRQVPLGDYVCDFVCMSRKLVVELDGSQHQEDEQATFDAQRSAVLMSAGFRIVRVSVSDLYNDREAVIEAIWQGLQ